MELITKQLYVLIDDTLISGFTTNPTLMRKDGVKAIKILLKNII